jgi:hypothetical protein
MAGKSRALKSGISVAAADIMLAAATVFSIGAGVEHDERAEVLLAKRPDRFVVYNKYQQHLSSAEAATLPPFVPIFVVREKDLLGDGITPCATVDIQGKRLYLLRDPDGELAGIQDAGPVQIVHGVEALHDTIVLRGERAIVSPDPADRRQYILDSGTVLVRAFRDGSRTFVGSTTSNPLFGWITLPPGEIGKTWVKRVTSPVQTLTIKEAMRRLLPAVSSANAALRSMYAHLRGNNRQPQIAPAFVLSVTHDTIACDVQPNAVQPKFSRSLEVLQGEFEGELAGSSARLTRKEHRIIITLP